MEKEVVELAKSIVDFWISFLWLAWLVLWAMWYVKWNNAQKKANIVEKDNSEFMDLIENNENISNIKNKKDLLDFNTVIVASWWSNDWNMENKVYFHPKTRSFRDGTKYLWFYNKGFITGYWEIEKMSENEIRKLLEKTWIEIFKLEKSIDEIIQRLDFFSCRKWFQKINIDWNSLDKNPVMSKQYISLDELLWKNK